MLLTAARVPTLPGGTGRSAGHKAVRGLSTTPVPTVFILTWCLITAASKGSTQLTTSQGYGWVHQTQGLVPPPQCRPLSLCSGPVQQPRLCGGGVGQPREPPGTRAGPRSTPAGCPGPATRLCSHPTWAHAGLGLGLRSGAGILPGPPVLSTTCESEQSEGPSRTHEHKAGTGSGQGAFHLAAAGRSRARCPGVPGQLSQGGAPGPGPVQGTSAAPGTPTPAIPAFSQPREPPETPTPALEQGRVHHQEQASIATACC